MLLRHSAASIRTIRRSVSRSVFQSLVSVLVLMKLDFGNSTLAGIPSFQLHHLQAVMNAPARLVFQSSRYSHITPLLHRLHWLRAPERITYKLAFLVYQCIRGLAPTYLADALHPVAQIPVDNDFVRLRPHLSTGCTTDTAPYDWRPSFPSSRGKSMEQLAVGSDVIKDITYVQIQPEDVPFFCLFPINLTTYYLL